MIVWLIAGPLMMALVVLPLRRFPLLTVPLSAAALLSMAALSLTFDPSKPLVILGRLLELSPQARMGVAISYVLLASAVLHTLRVPQGPLAHPLTLGAAGFFAGSIVVRNMAIAGLLLQAGIIMAAMLIPSGRSGSAATGIRTLVLLSLAGALFLLASWAEDRLAVHPEEAFLAPVVVVPLVLALGLGLGLVPFHVWLPPVHRQGHPSAAIVLGVFLHTAMFLRLYEMPGALAGPESQDTLSALFLLAGLATCIVGGLGALPQRSVSGSLAHAAIADMGVAIVALGIGTGESSGAAMLHLAYRGIGLVLVSMALGIVRFSLGGDDVDHLRGGFRTAPLAVVGMTIGGLSLAGFPPTAGFLSRLSIWRTLAAQHPGWTAVAIACSLGPLWAFARCAIAALTPARRPEARREPLFSALLMLPLGLALLALGVFPDLLARLPAEWLAVLGA